MRWNMNPKWTANFELELVCIHSTPFILRYYYGTVLDTTITMQYLNFMIFKSYYE